ncbi:MAG: DUF924 domain-containing protein [Comamonadaceae bacterium]|nr:MAG: DUF924 domain-containing protein [Comamonadaceae bacterium]
MSTAQPQDILRFWFEECTPAQWWAVDTAFDAQIRERFLPTLQAAAQAELHAWRATPEGRLAEIIVLDQFSRNVHRGTPQAFAQDPMALVLAQEAVVRDLHLALTPEQRAFLLLPFMHSESCVIHAWAEQLYRDFAPANNYDFELKHKAIVDRFGRYPHRNAILGRISTAEEAEFLKQPGSSF